MVVLIHGGLGAEMDADRFWRRTGIEQRLCEYGFAVRAPDRLPHAPSWEAEAAHLLPSLPPGPLVLVSGSNGGSVAVRLALALGDRVSRLALCWPATAGSPEVDDEIRAYDPRLAGLLAGETLCGVTDAELLRVSTLTAVVPSVPENRFHQRSTVDKLVQLLPGIIELPGSPEPPRPEFPSFVDSYVAALAGFAS